MSLNPGTNLGSFEVSGLLGTGGMGEVYRARDTKLDREVAIKVLPDALSRVPQRVARFEREAKLLAALNHPGIAGIHEFGKDGDTHFLVMELVEGATLAKQLSTGALPVETALELFGQIAQALDYAHGKGVIHRDLKPANIKTDPEGQAKILDFGLAKAFDVSPTDSDSEAPTKPIASKRDESTQEGMILGTPAYMSPEQAQGKEVDKRTDIWGFGCCLYQALTGQRPFNGETSTELLADIIRGEPDWNALPVETPGRIRDLLWRCLQKEPKRRLRDIGDAWFEISDSASAPSGAFEPLPTTVPEKRSPFALLGWVVAVIVIAAWLSLGTLNRGVEEQDLEIAAPIAKPKPVRRYTLSLPDKYPIAAPIIITDTLLDLSRDGSLLVYVTDMDGTRQLVLTRRDSFKFDLMAGTEGASSPFFSPDGQWIGFYVPGSRELKKVSVRVGTVTKLADATIPLGAVWRDDGTIFFASEITSGLRRMPEIGGEPETFTEIDRSRGDLYHVAPTLLPGGTHIIFLSSTGNTINDSRTEILSLETGERKQITEKAGRTIYLNSGHLLYIREGRVVIRPFDLESLEFSGSPIPVNEDRMAVVGSIPSQYAHSDEGTLVYVPVSPGINAGRELVWIDREGNETSSGTPAGPRVSVNLSPDASQVVVGQDNLQDLWIFDLVGDAAPRRFTFDTASDIFGIWNPEGDEIFFTSMRTGDWRLHRRRLDGRGGAKLVPSDGDILRGGPLSISSFDPSGRLMLFTTGYGRGTRSGADIGVIDLEDDSNSRLLLHGPESEMSASFSPDGKWIVYTSDETGRDEIFICSFPDLESKRQVSDKGGSVPRWNPSGGEIFYKEANRLMSVKIDFEPNFRIGRPKVLFTGFWSQLGTRHFYDVAPDGERFLVIKAASRDPSREDAAALTEINVIENWFEEITRLAPVG